MADRSVAVGTANGIDHPRTREKYGKYLTRAAWGIEFIAAAIGLFIAFATIFSTQSEIQKEIGTLDASAWMNIFISDCPSSWFP